MFTDLFDLLANLSQSTHVALAALLGLLIGSFLNVVILRYPIWMKAQWSAQSREWLELNDDNTPVPSIVKPASHCPACKVPLKFWQNIPLVSYILLAGKCADCKQGISIRYPLIELLTAILSCIVMWRFGFSLACFFALILTWVLITLSFIDIDHQLLPDDIVVPTLWLGLGVSLYVFFSTPHNAILGAILGYMMLWSVFYIFKLLTGKDGMGFGDFKLLSLLGAWLGWQYLPQILLISTLLGSIIGLSLIAFKKMNKDKPIPFGPYLAFAGWLALIWGDKINSAYLHAFY